jgi:hypothetical protein
MFTAIALIIYCCSLALCGILLWYVIDFLPMPENMKNAAHLLLAVILILYGIGAIAGTYIPHHPDDGGTPYRDQPIIPIPKGPASIMK